MTLQVRFWGTRGSIPSPGPGTVRYGGNTSCLEVRVAASPSAGGRGHGAVAILDAGTGIRPLGQQLLAEAGGAPLVGDIFITHAHWDHIQGLPFFAPLFGAGHRFRIWTAAELSARIERALRAQMAPEVFPVPFEQVHAELEFMIVDGAPAPGALDVQAIRVRHPGGALGYRLSSRNGAPGTIVYIPDNELGPEASYDAPPDWRRQLVSFVRGASVLVHDAMYSASEREAFRGWGHSSVDEAVELALEAEIPRLVLFHHRPERTDAQLDELLDRARARVAAAGAALVVDAAAEGMCLSL